nr:MAG TPA: hypothetical protein [Caudoviricetes sp.]
MDAIGGVERKKTGKLFFLENCGKVVDKSGMI